ncbi:MAG TPA: phage tail tip lysozyme [Streptosporangiaceae bacterium]
MRRANTASRKPGIRSTGRHAAPARFPRAAARTTRIAVPALALAGALAAAPQLAHALAAGPAAPAAHPQAARLSPVPAPPGPAATAAAGLRGGDPRARVAALAAFRSARQQARRAAARQARQQAARRARQEKARQEKARQDGQQGQGQPGHAALSCGPGSGLLPANYPAIMEFLTGHGYTAIASAGIAGNIYQESGGNPESVGSGGGGLIGWTPLPAGFVTGSPAADLRTQLAAILTYNQQWAQFIPALNSAASAAAAAQVYMSDFERPGIPAAANREAAASAVAAACGL